MAMPLETKDINLLLLPPFPEYELSYPDFIVRPAVSDPVENDFLRTISDAFGPPPMTHEYFEQDIAEGWYTMEDCLVMYDGENPVAAGQIRLEKRDERLIGFLDTIGVPKIFQGKGYGKELTKRRIQMLLKLGVSEIRTEVEQNNEPMLRLLLKLGFTRI